MNAAQASIAWPAAHWSAKRASILLTIVALVLWSYSITQARFEIGFYGLISGFPVSFFIALGILTLASAVLWPSREDHGKLLFLQLCLLIAAIWLAPIMVRGSQPFISDAYGDLGFIEYVVRNGHVDPRALWQQNWPPAWIFWASSTRVLGIDMDDFSALIPWVPFLWQLLLFLPLFVFFRNTIGKVHINYCWAAMWLFYLGNWFETQNTGAQAFGVFFFFAILALLTMTMVGKPILSSFGHRLAAVIILVVSAPAHLLGSIVSLGAVAGLTVSRRIRSFNLVLLAASLVVAWSLYGSWRYLESKLPAFLEQGLRMDTATKEGILNPLSGSPSHAAVALVRIIVSGMFLALAVSGGLAAWRLGKDRRSDVTVLAIVAGCSVIAAFVAAGYSHELYQRFYVFLLPAVAYFGVKLLRYRATAVILCLSLLILLPLAFIAKYGDEKMDHLSPGYLSGASLFQDKTSGGYVVSTVPLGRMKNFEQYRFAFSYGDLKWQDNRLVLGSRFDPAPRYIGISNHDRAYFAFYRNEPQLVNEVQGSLNTASNCNLVYANPDLSLYVNEAQE